MACAIINILSVANNTNSDVNKRHRCNFKDCCTYFVLFIHSQKWSLNEKKIPFFRRHILNMNFETKVATQIF